MKRSYAYERDKGLRFTSFEGTAFHIVRRRITKIFMYRICGLILYDDLVMYHVLYRFMWVPMCMTRNFSGFINLKYFQPV